MIRRATAQAIDETAARWAARLDRAPLSAAEQALLDRWLAEDARHYGAFARAQATMAAADRGPALGSGLERLVEAEAQAERGVGRRALIGWAAAAAAVTATGVVPVINWFGSRRLQTARGEVQMVALEDGSRVTLDTATRVVARFDDRARLVDLVEGEALFDVAKDRRRPFLVRAGDTEVRAVGTSFSVALLPTGEVRVLVREGLVDVRKLRSAAAVPVAANSMALVPADAPVPAPHVVADQEVSRRLAWREGMLAFEGERLDAAIAQFARYSDVPILIADEDLAGRRISGWFSASDPKGFARAAALSLGVRAEETADGILLHS